MPFFRVATEMRHLFNHIKRTDGSTLEADPNEIVELDEHPKDHDELDKRFVPVAGPVAAKKAAKPKAKKTVAPKVEPEPKIEEATPTEGGEPPADEGTQELPVEPVES